MHPLRFSRALGTSALFAALFCLTCLAATACSDASEDDPTDSSAPDADDATGGADSADSAAAADADATDAGTDDATEDGTPGQDSGEGDDTEVSADAATTDGGAGADDATSDGDDAGQVEVGVGTIVAFSIHNVAGQQCLDFGAMTVSDDVAADCDVIVSKSPAGPVVMLGPGVLAQDLGAALAFDDVDEVPADGYEGDEAPLLVIGASWRNGGVGDTGFDMSNHVYAFLRPDGTFAKGVFLSAISGTIEGAFFHQPDGTRNVATADSL